MRVVPHAVVRYGAHVASDCILMPSYVNLGAYVGERTMVDTWATVGSCAQIGADVHLSGGVGIGGVLEPLQASPVIVEDGAFIGSRCIVVEGACGQGSRAWRQCGADCKHAHLGCSWGHGSGDPRCNSTRAVVIPGTRPKTFPAGTYQVPCLPLIIGERKASTDRKTSLTEALRQHDVAVYSSHEPKSPVHPNGLPGRCHPCNFRHWKCGTHLIPQDCLHVLVRKPMDSLFEGHLGLAKCWPGTNVQGSRKGTGVV